MFKFVCRRQGAISIFLLIVMVPILVVSSIFVDMSRIRLAKSVATSAGDLALNTALTDYDAVLKDMYGLFATSQNVDELLVNLEDYYKKAIEAAGVAPADAEDYVGQIMSMLKSSTGTDDLLNMNLTDFTVTKPTGGNLANPAILKTQVVEFMKYRAPLSLGSGFLEALQSMKNLNKQTDLVDNKNDFYEQQKGILEKLESAWREIQAYQYADASAGFPTGNYITDKKGVLDADVTVLKDEVIPDTLNYLYYKEWFKNNGCNIRYEAGDDDETIFDDMWYFDWFGATVTCTRAYGEDSTATTDNVLECLQNVLSSIKDLEKYISDSEYNHVYSVVSTTQTSKLGKIYATAQFYKAGKSGYALAVKNLLQNLVNLESAMACCDEEEMKAIKVTYIAEDYSVELAESGSTTLYSIAKNQLDAHYTLDGSKGSSKHYLVYFKNYASKLNGYVTELSSTVTSKATNVKSKFDASRDHALEYYALIDKKIKNLENAITYLNGVKTDLSSSDSAYSKALAEWETSANALSDDTMGKNDKKEIEELKKLLTAEKVGSLITRLTNAKTTLESVRTQIAAYKFEGTAWKDIPDNSGHIKVLGMLTTEQKNALEAIVPDSDDDYASVITMVNNTVVSGNITTSWNNDKHPDLTKDQRELYTWLYNNYYNPTMNYTDLAANTNQTASGDDELESRQEDLKKEADAYKDKKANSSTKVATNINDYIEYLPSTEWEVTLASIESGTVETDADKLLSSSSDAVDGLLSQVMGLLGDMGTKLRDDMYISNYVMSMFSYDTFEAELTKELSGTTTGFNSWYEYDEEKKEYKVKDAYADYAAQALTLTKNSINPNMNYLYGSEVEYIIYGGADMDANKAKAYGTIFLLRFAFNTVYAFTDAEINNITMAAATAIFGTPPLTPLIPIAKIAMIIGLSIAESAYDLFLIKSGESVPLIKNNKTWVMKPSGAIKAASAVVLNKVVDVGVEAGYQVLNDALQKTDEELMAMISGSEEELNKLATELVNSTVDKLKNYANEAVQQVVTLCNDANLSEMMNGTVRSTTGEFTGMKATTEKVNYVISGLDTWLGTQETGDTIYEVKKIAVEYLKSDGGKAIQDIFAAIESSSGSCDGTVLNTKLEELRSVINTKITTATGMVGESLDKMREETITALKDAAKDGAEQLRTTLKNQISLKLGTTAGAQAGTSTVVSNLLSWSYSDYLTLFLLVSTVANEEAVLLRMADIIELNMQHMNHEYASITTTETKEVSRFFGLWKYKKEVTTTEENQKAFKLNKAYTFLRIEATIEVRPLLLTIPLVEDTTESQLTGTNWYEIKYTGTLGY